MGRRIKTIADAASRRGSCVNGGMPEAAVGKTEKLGVARPKDSGVQSDSP